MAKGSHTTLGGWEPKTCTACGTPIKVTLHTAWYHHDHITDTSYAWCAACIKEGALCNPPSATSRS